jgi:hypothetical protein
MEDERFAAGLSSLLRGVDIAAFRQEHCWRRDPEAPLYASLPPFFEVYGEELVRLGRYDQVIRYEDHIHPIEKQLATI